MIQYEGGRKSESLSGPVYEKLNVLYILADKIWGGFAVRDSGYFI